MSTELKANDTLCKISSSFVMMVTYYNVPKMDRGVSNNVYNKDR